MTGLEYMKQKYENLTFNEYIELIKNIYCPKFFHLKKNDCTDLCDECWEIALRKDIIE